MSKKQPTENEKKRIFRIADLVDKGPVVLLEFIEELENKFDAFVKESKDNTTEIVEAVNSLDKKNDGIDYQYIISQVVNNIPVPENGKDGKDGKTPEIDYRKIIEEVIEKIPAVRPEAVDYNFILAEVLKIMPSVKQQDYSLLIKEEIEVAKKDLEKFIEDNAGKNIRFVGNGAGGMFIYVDEVKKGIVKMIDFKGGTNITLGYAITNGIATLTINNSGAGSPTSATGTVNGANVTFTVGSIPNKIYSDNSVFFEGFGYSRSGLTITMFFPPQYYVKYD